MNVVLEKPETNLARPTLRKSVGAENKNLFVARTAGHGIQRGIGVSNFM